MSIFDEIGNSIPKITSPVAGIILFIVNIIFPGVGTLIGICISGCQAPSLPWQIACGVLQLWFVGFIT